MSPYRVCRRADTAVMSGEIDITNAQQVLVEALASSVPRVLDMSGVTSFSAAGVRMVLALRRHASEAGISVKVIGSLNMPVRSKRQLAMRRSRCRKTSAGRRRERPSP